MVVTVSNQYGCGAQAIARQAAALLGYTFVDEQLPIVVSKRLGTSPDEVDAAQDPRRNWQERLLEGLPFATPELGTLPLKSDFERECLREVEEAVREFAGRGDAVIFGRAANAVLGRRCDVLRIFMHAPYEWRVRHLMEGLHLEREAAGAEIARIDRARRAYVKQYYDLEWGSVENYDLALDTARFQSAECAHIIVEAVRRLAPA